MNSLFLKQKTAVENIYDIVSVITPLDTLEEEHIANTLAWLTSGEPIFRIAKPDIPNKHLVSYFVVFDEGTQKVLLVDHKKAQLWLPTGGHVEVDEDPKETIRRECFEELGMQADFWVDQPIFLTSTRTVGLTAGHTDISLWYVLTGNHHTQYKFDKGEFNEIKWFLFDDIPYEKSDPHMSRFIKKLRISYLG
jgi:8-oxo-dGTP diphosphatase